MKLCRLPLVAVVCFALLASAAAQEWSRFRGPNGTGESEAKGIPTKWTEADYNWKVSLPGIGHSSPVLWGDKLFLLSADPTNATRYLLCLNAKTGKTLWQREYKSSAHHLHERNSFASCTPACDEERVYVAWSTPEKVTFLALDHEGNDVWQLDLGPFVSQHGWGASPMIYKDLVVLANMQLQDLAELGKVKGAAKPGESSILGVDRKTGDIRWQSPHRTSVAAYSVPCVYKNDKGEDELICCASGNDVFSLDPATGKQNWSVEAFSMRTVSSPVIAAGRIFGTTGSGGGGNYVVAVLPGETPKIDYEIKKAAPYVPCPVAKGDELFLWSDKSTVISCVDAKTGEVQGQFHLGGNLSGSPIRVGDRMYAIDEDGVVHVVSADRELKPLAENPLGEPSRATPSVAGGQMFLRTESHLIAVGGGKG